MRPQNSGAWEIRSIESGLAKDNGTQIGNAWPQIMRNIERLLLILASIIKIREDEGRLVDQLLFGNLVLPLNFLDIFRDGCFELFVLFFFCFWLRVLFIFCGAHA